MAKPMSKSKIVAHIARKVGTPKKTVATFFDELFKLAVKERKSGTGKFVIPGLGRAVKVHGKARKAEWRPLRCGLGRAVKAHRKARMGRNPQTGEPIKIKAKTVVRLRAAKRHRSAAQREALRIPFVRELSKGNRARGKVLVDAYVRGTRWGDSWSA